VEDIGFVFSIYIEGLFNFVEVSDAVLDQRLTFTSQNGLVDDSRARQNEQITRHRLFLLDVRVAMLGFVATDHYDITRENFVTHYLLPLA